ncbi:MAG TPA: crossover junction endodeoxyribonuclease RuvC [Acidobacteriaceae bacterium]|jgi:crossover junction endodeoxyribonuclease RuvC
MRVCGIDCGTETTGYGIVECDDRSPGIGHAPRLLSLDAGGICPPRKALLPARLAFIYGHVITLLERHRPDVVAVEEVFYSVNAKSALKLGHVRGVILLAAATAGIAVAEYAPLTIKSTVTGYGLAAKQQVQFMVARLLTLAQAPEPADAADALAIAICHIHHAQTLSLQEARVS